MSGESDPPKANPQASAPSAVQQLLAWLDACRADKRPMGADEQRDAMQALEQRLAAVVPMGEADFFSLAARLQDKALAPATRDGIAANLAKAAPLMASRRQRLLLWLTTYNLGLAELRNGRAEALDSLTKGTELSQVAQAAVANAAAGHSVIAPIGLGFVLEAALHQLEQTNVSLVCADIQFEAQMTKLNELVADESAETALFVEAVSSTTH